DAGLGGNGLEQIFERFHASGGGADADYGKWLIHRLPQQGSKGNGSACGGRLALRLRQEPCKFKAPLTILRCDTWTSGRRQSAFRLARLRKRPRAAGQRDDALCQLIAAQ